MINKIHIVNLLLTRKCNLKCDYCGIARNKDDKPKEYKPLTHYFENEMETSKVLDALTKLKIHNPEVFIIIYGGEPLLRRDLHIIINFCNDMNINYTIISNNTDEINPQFERLLKNVEYIKGYTASVDPLIFSTGIDDDRREKSIKGINKLKALKANKKIDDLVAEITVDKSNLIHLNQLVATLTEFGISSDITFIDIAKTPYYDFSNITSDDLMIKSREDIHLVRSIFHGLINDPNYDIHMKQSLLPEIANCLPSNLDCEMENDINTIAIDADGSMRLCLRVRGVLTPEVDVLNIFQNGGTEELSDEYRDSLMLDKAHLCKGCNHTCYIMGNLISQGIGSDELIHTDRRR